jgi:hypothetical protein
VPDVRHPVVTMLSGRVSTLGDRGHKTVVCDRSDHRDGSNRESLPTGPCSPRSFSDWNRNARSGDAHRDLTSADPRHGVFTSFARTTDG